MSTADQIKDTVLEFIDDISDAVFDTEEGDLLMAKLLFQRTPATTIAQHVVENILKYKTQISERKLSFFLEKKGIIFEGIGDPQKVEKFSRKICQTSEENIKIIWDYFDVLIELAEEYKKKK